MKIRLGHIIQRRLLEALGKAGECEIGGLLMGEQSAPGDFTIVDISVAEQSGSEVHFERRSNDHRVALEGFFEATGGDYERFNYLGEWHSHPNCAPVPSGADIMAMRELLDEEAEIPFSVLLICRASGNTLALSATLFQRDLPYEGVEIIANDLQGKSEGSDGRGEN